MKKTLLIEGMMCGHCKARVEKALNALTGVSAEVDLENKRAYVEVVDNVSDNLLTQTVDGLGFKVTGIM